MTVNYAAMAINEGFDPEHPEAFNWGKAKYHPTYAHWRDSQMGQHMEGYKGTAIVPDGALRVAQYPPPDVEMEVYNRREVMEITGPTSGSSALLAACKKGFNPIFLIGYDYYEMKTGMYGYGNEVSKWNTVTMDDFNEKDKWPVYESSLRSFKLIRKQYADVEGIEIFNCNADSMLGEFPYMSMDDALEYIQ